MVSNTFPTARMNSFGRGGIRSVGSFFIAFFAPKTNSTAIWVKQMLINYPLSKLLPINLIVGIIYLFINFV